MHLIKPRLLVLAPHCDDAEFGVGAYLKRMSGDADIRVVIFGHGSYTNVEGDTVSGADRMKEAIAALEILGVDDVVFRQGFTENQGLSADYPALVTMIEKEVIDFSPDTVFTCLPSFNQDHRVLYDATVTAFRPINLRANLCAYEYPGSSWGIDLPSWGKRYLRTTPESFNAKMDALRAHKSQFENRTVGVGPEAAYVLMRQRGAEIGVSHAELVYVMREIH